MISNFLRPIYDRLRHDAEFKSYSSNKISKQLVGLDYLAWGIGTCGGIGYMPIAPATWGSMFGVMLYLVALKASGLFAVWADMQGLSSAAADSIIVSFSFVFLSGLFLIGIWSASRIEQLTGKKDPGIVVIDEVVGQIIALLVVPAMLGWWAIVASFITFRVFDIWKIYPTKEMESLPGGLGIMTDDLMAGIYAAVLISVVSAIFLFAFH